MAREIELPNGSKKRIPEDIPQHSVDHFLQRPYARAVIEDPAFRLISQSRTVTHDGRGHTLMGKTWNTDDTIQQLLTLFRPSTSEDLISSSETERAEMRRFYTFGGDLNAHPDLLHGGVVACILDSSLGGAIGMTLASQQHTPIFTVQLNITYKAPVRTPGTIMIRSWVTKVEKGGRKAWAKGVIESENGTVHALAEGMWVSPKPKM